MSEKLPNGWCWTTFEELVKKIQVGLVRSAKLQSEDKEYLYLKMNNITSGGRLAMTDVVKVNATEQEVEQYKLSDGDFLFNTRNSFELVGKTAVYNNLSNRIVLFNNNILRAEFSEVKSNYINYWFNSPEGKAKLENLKSATTNVAAIYQKKLMKFQIPIAPQPEQKHIVAKLDCLLAKVDACKARLDKVPEIIKRFRQSVLADAVSGKLTEDWREENPDIESGQSLIENIIKRKQGELKSTKNKKYSPLSINNAFKIVKPVNWGVTSIECVTRLDRTICYVVIQPGKKLDEGIPLVRVCDLDRWKVQYNNLRNISSEIHNNYSRSRVQIGDVLVSVVGTIGRTAVITNNSEANIARAIARISVYEEILPDWLNFWLNHPEMQFWLVNSACEVARKTLNLSSLSTAPFVVPPTEEQKEIISRVEALFSVADQLEEKLLNAHSRVEKLTASILSKAFRGELVPQNLNDEPAEMLLKRIRAEREALATSKKKGGRIPKKRSGRGKRTPSQKADFEAEPETVAPKSAKAGSAKATAGAVNPRKQAPKSIEKRFEKTDFLKAFRKAAFRRNALDEDSLLRLVCRRLSVRRLSRPTRRELETAIPTALRRNIIARNMTGYYGATPTIHHYDDSELIKVLRSVIRKGYEYEREHLIAEAAAYLGFDKVSDAFAEKMKTVFRLAIRRGQLYRNGKYVGKI